MKQEYIENNLFVDLGLPSGTLWCKYNLGVDLSKLNHAENWYGDYYAWGETCPKADNEHCVWETYKYAKKGGIGEPTYVMTKYTITGKNPDKLAELLSEDDAAYQINNEWKIPTLKLVNELIDNTNSIWEKDYKGIKSLNGKTYIGKNGNSIFIPAAGWRQEDVFTTSNDDNGNYHAELKASHIGEYIVFLTSSLEIEFNQNYMCFTSYPYDHGSIETTYRCQGLNIRPVKIC